METQLLTDATVSLMRVRPDKNERRFYTLTVDIDLFGCALLVRRWGRLGTYGCTRFEAHQTEPAALAALATLERIKRRRGYWNRGAVVREPSHHHEGDDVQVELLSADRDRVQERLEAAEEQITVAKAQYEAERRLREVAEADADKFKGLFDSASQEIRILRGDLNQARSDLEAKATALAEMAVRFAGEIQLRGLANKEIESARGDLARVRAESSAAAETWRADLEAARSMLNEALADVRLKDTAIESLRHDLEEARRREINLEERVRKASHEQLSEEKGQKSVAADKKEAPPR
jgi:predicted DNA-binding WGR domain protein